MGLKSIPYKLNFIWRLFATGLSFSIFGVGSLILGVLIIPLVPKGPRVRRLISVNFKLFFLMMHYLGILRFRVIGRELIANDKGCLVVANHPSLIDVIALISLYPNACCIVKRQLWSNFFVRKVVSGAGYIPNEDPELLLENCKKSLDRGEVLVIFPEGTRTNPGQAPVLQRGAAHIALRLKRPIRVIKIEVCPSTLTKNLPWYKIAQRRVDFTVTIKGMLPVVPLSEGGLPFSLASRRLTAEISENISIV